jgi:hypothetical protein
MLRASWLGVALMVATSCGGDSGSTPAPDAPPPGGCGADDACAGHGQCNLTEMVCTCDAQYYRCGQGCCAWEIAAIDTNSRPGSTTDLALDSAGRPHIAYSDATNDDLKYARFDGTQWLFETVDTGGVGWHSSLALDATDTPHISHYAFGAGDLKYAARSNGIWSNETVDSVGITGRKTSLAIDGSGNPHLSYHDTGLDNLRYAHKDGGVWVLETVDEQGDVGDFTALAIDAMGRVHITYYLTNDPVGGKSGDLLYALRDPAGSWTFEVVDTIGVVGMFTSLALDPAGNPHISYREETNYPVAGLKYARRDVSGWHVETVEAGGDLADFNTSIAVDSQSRPHISYLDATAGVLKYAQWTGTSWLIQVVDSQMYSGHYSAIALDANDHPNFSYTYRDQKEDFPNPIQMLWLKFAK